MGKPHLIDLGLEIRDPLGARSFNAMAERVRGMIMGQKELMAGVSHELRSPLTRMKLSLELLREVSPICLQ